MIPQEKKDPVIRGLREAFGVTDFEAIFPLRGGLSPGVLVFQIAVRGRPYLLRMIMRKDDPTRHFACMQAAAEAGLAPRVWYISIEDKLFISDFVKAVPFPRAEALVRLTAALRKLHALAPFASAPFNTTCTFLLHKGADLEVRPALSGFVENFKASTVLSRAEIEECFGWYAEIAAVYPHENRELVPSHNDLFKPDNILFDGQRVWLVDWEAAFLNDRYADLAVVANMIVTNDIEERAYLQEYFGQPPDRYQQARFFLMQQIAHLFYAMVFLSSPAGKAEGRSEKALDDLHAFYGRLWAGEIHLDADTKLICGRLHWKQLLHNGRQPRFREALKIVSDRR